MRQRVAWVIFLGITALAMWGARDYFLVRMNERAGIALKREALAALARVQAGRVSDDVWAKMRKAFLTG